MVLFYCYCYHCWRASRSARCPWCSSGVFAWWPPRHWAGTSQTHVRSILRMICVRKYVVSSLLLARYVVFYRIICLRTNLCTECNEQCMAESLLPVSGENKRSFQASICHAILQQRLLSAPCSGALEAWLSTYTLLRSSFFTDTGIAACKNKGRCSLGREILYTTTSWKWLLRLRLYQNWDKSFYTPPTLGGGGGGV